MDGKGQTDLLDELFVGDGARVLPQHPFNDRRPRRVVPGIERGDHSINVH